MFDQLGLDLPAGRGAHHDRHENREKYRRKAGVKDGHSRGERCGSHSERSLGDEENQRDQAQQAQTAAFARQPPDQNQSQHAHRNRDRLVAGDGRDICGEKSPGDDRHQSANCDENRITV